MKAGCAQTQTVYRRYLDVPKCCVCGGGPATIGQQTRYGRLKRLLCCQEISAELSQTPSAVNQWASASEAKGKILW